MFNAEQLERAVLTAAQEQERIAMGNEWQEVDNPDLMPDEEQLPASAAAKSDPDSSYTVNLNFAGSANNPQTSPSAALTEEQKQKRMIIIGGALLAVLIILIIAVTMFKK